MAAKPRYWLMKSEPDVYGIEDLRRDGVGEWDGVRNYQVRNFFRDDFTVGDQAIFYHSSTKVPGAAGVLEVVGEAVPDKTQFDKKSEYYDEKSRGDTPRWLAVPVRFVSAFKEVVPLSVLRQDPALRELLILRPGNRLSVTPLTAKEFRRIVKLGEGK